jgi:positive regulator of sigma E activity
MPLVLLLLVVAFVAKFFWLLLAVAFVAVAGRLIGWLLARRDDRAVATRQRDAELCARADRQQAQVLAGDDRGVYGEFAPAEVTQS